MKAIDRAPLGPLHRRLLLYANAGLFCDGYILSSIGLAIPSLTPQFHLNALASGLIAAATLLGILIGAVIFGPLTDRFGRRIMMVADLCVFVVVSLLQLAAGTAAELVLLRFALGVAIGADYPIAAALLSEYMPARGRGAALNSMQVVWFLGACVAYAAGNAMLGLPQSWRWILASAAIPALVGLALRARAPESVRWLAAKGRHAEAAVILRRHFDGAQIERIEPSRIARLQRGDLGALAFVSSMWLLQVVPLFAVYTFAPTVLAALHVGAASPLGSLAITVAFLAGSLLATPLLDAIGRRAICIAGFAVATVAFALLSFASGTVVVAVFVVYAVAIGAAAGLELIYPAELFATPVRATATGVAAGISRIGAFVGTFALPLALARFGIGDVMLASALISLAGLAVSIAYAPETRGRVLDAAR